MGEAETPHHAIASILRIREYLTELLQQLPEHSNLAPNLRALRSGAREFLTRLERRGANPDDMRSYGHWASWEFLDALGRLRGGFGMHLAVIAERYDCVVPQSLMTILPPVVNDDF